MAETLTPHGDGRGTWRWHDMMRDLEEQGGISGVTIDPLSFTSNSAIGEYEENSFAVSWKKDTLLMVTMIEFSEPLVRAFSKVVEYDPFCSWIQEVDEKRLTVVEWAKNDAKTRYAELEGEKTPGLKRLNPIALEAGDGNTVLRNTADAILGLRPEGQCVVSLDGQKFLLSISSTVGEKDFCKLWVQGPKAIKVDEYGPIEPYDQLIYRANVVSDTKIFLHERHGYSDVENGTELKFLSRLLTEGDRSWIEK